MLFFKGIDKLQVSGSLGFVIPLDTNDENRNLVTMAVGARFRVTEWLDVGTAYEFVLTDESKGMIEDRFQVDAVISVPF